MKAAVIEEFGDLNNIKISDIPTPEPEAHEVQIKIAYAALNPVDWKICAGYLRERMPYEFPITLGWDVAGEVTKVGKEVTSIKIGDAVFGYARKAKIKDGTLADYICLEANSVAIKPAQLNFSEAAAIPLTGLTAWQCLFDAAKLQPHEIIFIPAGAGGVGSMAIQFAKQQNATVITTANESNHPYVKKLGGGRFIDYRKENFARRIKQLYPQGIDVVFDTVGGGTLDASLSILKCGGRLVSILQEIPPEIAAKHQSAPLRVCATKWQTTKIHWIYWKQKSVAANQNILLKTQEALEELKQGHTHGKLW